MANLILLAQSHLDAARAADNGRSAELLLHDGPLRQTVIALVAGTELAEHNSPSAASLQVLVGRVQVTGMEVDEVAAGEVALLTHLRHAVRAEEDSVFLLTTVTGVEPAAEPTRAR
ncbi:cupin [Cellulomonas cellasea]|uniref:cupin n=1 Tax=Cellulomonas cellasea TaxID=43670 RepID=UPI0025A4C1D2|nr:cupin [Cellulomonas cellasea]MDM8084573.1 cupin [Cellulomonas cellasea]